MKANELMIGDWVMQDDNLQQNRVCQITGIYDNVVVNVTGEKVPLHESHIQPMPLTEEILKANGFEYRRKNFAALSYEHPFQLEMVKWPDENGIGLWMVRGLLKIRYVHELQHALRLCGIEKEIIL